MSELSFFRNAVGSVVREAPGTRAASHGRRAFADERGAVFAVTAIAIIPLIIALGIVIDISRGYLARSELSYVIDSAGFVAGRSFDAEENFRGIWSLFDVDLEAGGYGTALADTALQTVLDKVANRLTIKAEATIPTYFLRIAGIDRLTVEAETVRIPHRVHPEADVGEEQESPDAQPPDVERHDDETVGDERISAAGAPDPEG